MGGRTLATGETIGRLSMVDQVANRLRDMLLTGEIEPGQRLRLRDLEEWFGVSHIPIREALRRLESEGLVENKPQRGAVATLLSVDQLGEVYDVRRLLEPALVERAVRSATDADIETIRKVLARLEEAESERDVEAFYDAHHEFHWQILRAGASDLLEQILNQLWRTSERFIRLSVSAFPTNVRAAHEQHHKMTELFESRDGNSARALLEDHLHLTENAIRRNYEVQSR